jgi:hypothetical protein
MIANRCKLGNINVNECLLDVIKVKEIKSTLNQNIQGYEGFAIAEKSTMIGT